MEKYHYTADEAKKLEEQLQKQGIKNGSTKHLQTIICIRQGAPLVMEHLVSVATKLTEEQFVDICTSLLFGLDSGEIKEMCENPQEIETLKQEYLEQSQYEQSSRQESSRQEIYKEIFEEFHARWRLEFNQLQKQTEILSSTLEFLKDQINQKDKELASFKNKELLSPTNNEEGQRIRKGEVHRQVTSREVEPSEAEAPLGSSGQGLFARIKGMFGSEVSDSDYLLKLFEILSEDQMEEVINGYEKGLSVEELRKYARKENSAAKMKSMKRFLLKKYDQSEPR